MAELFGIRADGAFRTDTTAPSNLINKDWELVFSPSAQADFYNLIGVAPGSNSAFYQGIQDVVVDGASAYTCKVCSGADEVFRSRPGIVLDKRNLTAASHTIKSRAYGNNQIAGGGAAGNGIAFWSLTDAQWAASASATNSTTDWTDILTKTFTPGSQQDYLVIASIARAFVGASNHTGYLDLEIDGTEYGYHYESGNYFTSGRGEPPHHGGDPGGPEPPLQCVAGSGSRGGPGVPQGHPDPRA